MSIVTIHFSKQTKLTLPGSLGRALGLQEGDRVEVRRRGQALWLRTLKNLSVPGPLTDLTKIIHSTRPGDSVDLEAYMNRRGYEQFDDRPDF